MEKKSISEDMKGLYALLAVLFLSETTISQTTTRYRNPWVELVRQISCRSVTCNFQETCDLQVVCTPFGDCGQRATCLQIPFPRNTVCPDPFTNAGPPYTVECFDDAGCREPMVCCHSYAKSYCHMPPFSATDGSTVGNVSPSTSVLVEPVSESGLINQGAGGSARNGNASSNRNNAGANTESSGRGGRSVVLARSDFFDPQGVRIQQRQDWLNSLERRRRQQLDSLNGAIRAGELRDRNEIRVDRVGDDGIRANVRRNLNGGQLTVEISGQPSRGSVIDVNGVRIAGNGVPTISRVSDGNGPTIQVSATGPGGVAQARTRVRTDDLGISEQEILRGGARDEGSNGQVPRVTGAGRDEGRSGTPGDIRVDTSMQGTQPRQDTSGQATGRQVSQPRDGGVGGGPIVRVNLRDQDEARPLIRHSDFFRGHGFYGAKRRLLGDVQFDGFAGIGDRFRGVLPNII